MEHESDSAIGVLSTFTKRLVQGLEDLEIRGQVETIQITALLRLTNLLRRDLETYCHLDSSEKPSTNAGVKNSQKSKIIMIIKLNFNKLYWIVMLCTKQNEVIIYDLSQKLITCERKERWKNQKEKENMNEKCTYEKRSIWMRELNLSRKTERKNEWKN